MRRLHLVAAGTLILSTLIFANSQSPAPSPQTAATLTRIKQGQPVKAKKVLVKRMPKNLPGIVLDKGVFKLRPGYKFIPQSDNTVAVGLKVGGGVAGSFTCTCSKEGGGSCSVTTTEGTIYCSKGTYKPCSGECSFQTTIEGAKTSLAIF